MRACRHCSHQNADHLAYLLAVRAPAGRPDVRRPRWPRWRRRAARSGPGADGGAFSRTMLAHPRSSTGAGRAAVASARHRACRPGRRGLTRSARPAALALGWLGESIGYIYVYLRGKVDAGERRRRLTEERAGAEALLSGALNELGRDGPARGGAAPRPDRPARGDRPRRTPGARRRRPTSRPRPSRCSRHEATRLGAQETAAGGGVDGGRPRQPRGRRDPARDHRRSPTPPARAWRGSRTSGRASTRDGEEQRPGRRRARGPARPRGRGPGRRAARLEEQIGAARSPARRSARQGGGAAHRGRGGASPSSNSDGRAPAPVRVGDGGQHRGSPARSRRRRTRDRRSDRAARAGRRRARRARTRPLLSGYQNIDRLAETIADRGAQIAAIEQTRGSLRSAQAARPASACSPAC